MNSSVRLAATLIKQTAFFVMNEGEKEKAIDNLKKAEGMFGEMGMDYWFGKTQEVLATISIM